MQNKTNIQTPKTQAAKVDLVKELGIDKLSPEKQEQLLLQMNEVIQQRILMVIAEELDDDTRDQLDNLLENKGTTAEKLEKFLNEKAPNLENQILQEINQYKQEMLDFMEKIDPKTER